MGNNKQYKQKLHAMKSFFTFALAAIGAQAVRLS